MKEYRVKVSVRNNLLLKAIENAGYTNLAKFARAAKVPLQRLYNLSSMTEPPLDMHGNFTIYATTIMDFLGALPEDLWSINQLTLKLKSSSSSKEMAEGDLQGLLEEWQERMTLPDPAEVLYEKERSAIINKALERLPGNYRKLVEDKFGFNGEEKTFQQLGEERGTTKEPQRHKLAKSLRILRAPFWRVDEKEERKINPIHSIAGQRDHGWEEACSPYREYVQK